MKDSDTSTSGTLVEQLAEEYLARLQKGERPSIRQYTQEYPDHAEEIRDLFNTLVMMEELAPDPEDIAGQTHPWPAKAPSVLGDYRILNELGRGGMGVVYEAEHTAMRRRVALKVLHRRAAKRGHDLERFMREARSAGRLHHTNIVPVFEVGEHDGTHFYAMQCIRGQNLDLVIADLKRIQMGREHQIPEPPTDGAPSAAYGLLSGQYSRAELASASSPIDTDTTEPSLSSSSDSFTDIVIPDSSDMSNVGSKQENYFHRVARIGLQVADALAYAHDQGVLHRDIKPSNLILDTGGVVWVTDFGLARSEGEDLTHTGDIVGTLRYMAPERFQGNADVRSDIYSLGLTLYELCTLQYAFDRSDRADLIRQVTQQDPMRPRLVNATIPQDLETIVLKSIHRDPVLRYRSADEMADDLRLFLADRPIQARRASLVEQTWRWCRRNPAVASMLASIAMLVTVVFLGSIAFALTTRRHARETQQHALQLQEESKKVQAEHLNAQRSLFDAHVGQARASRFSGLRGQRFSTLDHIANAAQLLPDLRLSKQQVEEQRLLLRNIAISALPKVDLKLVRSWPAQAPTRMALSDDGQLVAIPDKSGQVVVRDVDTDRIVAKLDGPPCAASVLQMDPQAKYLAAWFYDYSDGINRTLNIYEIATSQIILAFDRRLDSSNFDFDDLGERLAVPRNDGQIEIYDLSDVDHPTLIQTDKQRRGVKYTPDGRLAVMIDNQIVYFDNSGKELDERLTFPARIRSINFTHNQVTVVGCDDSMVYYHDPSMEKPVPFGGHAGPGVRTYPSSDGRLLLSEAWSGERLLRSLPTGETLLSLNRLDFGWGGFAKDRYRFAASESNHQYFVWEVVTASCYYEIENTSDPSPRGVQMHPEDDAIAVIAGTNLEVWDIETKRRLAVIPDQQTPSAVFSPDGSKLYYGRYHNKFPRVCSFELDRDETTGARTVRLGEPKNIDQLRVYRRDGRSPHVAISDDGRRIAAFDNRGNVHIGDLTGEHDVVKCKAQPLASRITFSPDGSLLVTSAWQGKAAIVFDASSGERLQVLNPDLTSAFVDFSPDGKSLIVSGKQADYTWNTESWVSKQIVGDVSNGSSCQIAISNDSRLAAVAQSQFIHRLVRPDTGEVVAILQGPRSTAGIPAFSATGRYLLQVVANRMQVWDLRMMNRKLEPYGLDWDTTNF